MLGHELVIKAELNVLYMSNVRVKHLRQLDTKYLHEKVLKCEIQQEESKGLQLY